MEDIRKELPDKPTRFVDQFRLSIRKNGLSLKTEDAYLYWVKRYIRFNRLRHPSKLSEPDVENFLSHLALQTRVSTATQRLALNAIVFLYRKHLERPLGQLSFKCAKKERKIPLVLNPNEIRRLFNCMPRLVRLACQLMYGSGIRVSECVNLRVNDFDFDNRTLWVRQGKGNKDRATIIPERLVTAIKQQISFAELQLEMDIEQGHCSVFLPDLVLSRYPDAGHSLGWQYLFPSEELEFDLRLNKSIRHHMRARVIQRAVKKAAKAAQIHKQVGTHTLRHSFATDLMRSGTDIRTIQELLGHSDISTTAIYMHTSGSHLAQIENPIDQLSRP